MKTKTFLNLILISSIFSCNFLDSKGQDKKQLSIRLNNEALRIYSHHLTNIDSLNRALSLIDSAIFFDKNINFYNNKYIIARRLGKYQLALNSCDSILSRKNFDFQATLHKGFLYEEMNLKDSQILYYNKAFNLIDNPRSFNAGNMLRDREKIIIKGLLNDSLSYNRMFAEFKIKYDTSQFVNVYIEELSNFNRESHLSKY